jgi:hypothetical protein
LAPFFPVAVQALSMPIAPSDFWAANYYAHPPLTEDMVKQAEHTLGVRLPSELIDLLKVQNGGYTKGFAHPMRVRTTWAEDHVPLQDLFGIVTNGSIQPPPEHAGNPRRDGRSNASASGGSSNLGGTTFLSRSRIACATMRSTTRSTARHTTHIPATTPSWRRLRIAVVPGCATTFCSSHLGRIAELLE